jgi:hypothetical protein
MAAFRFPPGLAIALPYVTAIFLTNTPASAQFWGGGGGITVYTNPDFRGESASFREDAPDLRGYGMSDEISSIRVPPGESWEVCQDINYGNRCQIITRSISNLESIGWNDRISSLRRVRGGRGSRGSPGGGFGSGITVFTDADFEGESASFRDNTPDLVAYGLNDEISSIYIPPGESWEICQDNNYGNRCQIVTRSIPNLRNIGWDNRISSLRRTGGGGSGRGGPTPPPYRGGVTVFTNPNFSGESASFRDDTPDLVAYGLNDEISSIRVPAGESWEICQDINFGNRCQVITSSISNLRSIGWDDRISSLRRVDGRPR